MEDKLVTFQRSCTSNLRLWFLYNILRTI